MALSVSSLAAALSHLSLPSTSKPHQASLLRLHPSTSRRAVSLALRASAAEAAEPGLPAEEVVAVEAEAEEDAVSGVALRKYVKQRLPGGFAAQRITATGRRKTAIARVVLQEGTGKVFINFRDAKVPAPVTLYEKCARCFHHCGAISLSVPRWNL
jgi:small subunit ribosomal protein S9